MKPTMVTAPNIRPLKPGITVIGVGGGGGNAINNMIAQTLTPTSSLAQVD